MENIVIEDLQEQLEHLYYLLYKSDKLYNSCRLLYSMDPSNSNTKESIQHCKGMVIKIINNINRTISFINLMTDDLY